MCCEKRTWNRIFFFFFLPLLIFHVLIYFLAISAQRLVCSRVETSERALNSLLELHHEFKSLLAAELMKQIHAKSQKEKRDAALGRSSPVDSVRSNDYL